MPPVTWSVAIFAHNEAHHIVSTLEALSLPAYGQTFEVHVLANGCNDQTEALVRRHSENHASIVLDSIELADKANAWNLYVHQIAPDADVHFFTDGDVRIVPESLGVLARIFTQYPNAHAAGGFPMSGRNRVSWSGMMSRHGHLAGGLYALPRQTINRLREIPFRFPIGWVGDDSLLSRTVRLNLGHPMDQVEPPLIVLDDRAGFTFRSLSPWRLADWRIFWLRKIRDSVKQFQWDALEPLMSANGLEGLPKHALDLFPTIESLPRLAWNGRNTFFDALALRRIRRMILARQEGGVMR